MGCGMGRGVGCDMGCGIRCISMRAVDRGRVRLRTIHHTAWVTIWV